MKEKKSIEEQVAELTQKQQDTILKVDLIAGLIIALAIIPGIVLMIINFIAILDISLPFKIADKIVRNNFIAFQFKFFLLGGFSDKKALH